MSMVIVLSCVFIALIPASIAGDGYQYRPFRSLKDIRCLTGYMTDVQRWVDEYGQLTPWSRVNSSSIVILTTHRPERLLELEVNKFISENNTPIQYLSMSHCGMTRVQPVFHFQDQLNRRLADTLEYITFYGNKFGNVEADEELYDVFLNATDVTEIKPDISSLRKQSTLWSVGFHGFTFLRLKELDLRACAIGALGNNTFQKMPQLQSLYLGENHIHYIESTAFTPLRSLKYLDLSRNIFYDHSGRRVIMTLESSDVLRGIKLESLDLSYTMLAERNIGLVKSTESTLKTLSLCYTSLGNTRSEFLHLTSMKYLDVSGNPNILNPPSVIQGLRESIKVLYAQTILFRDMEFFRNFSNLEILKLSDNEVSSISPQVAQSLTSLQILDLDHNRMFSWSHPLFSLMPNLKMLSLVYNNINIIRGEMYNDLRNLSFIGLTNNALVCNCQAREMFEVALKNELRGNVKLITAHNKTEEDNLFHKGFKHYNQLIRDRRNITTFCKANRRCNFSFDPNIVGNYIFLDYYEDCLKAFEGSTVKVFSVNTCSQPRNDMEKADHQVHRGEKILLLLIPGSAIMFMGFLYAFRKNLKYFFVAMRNSAMLSLINNKDISDERLIYNYDVFVSYCNEDRAWVLDHLLPHVERDCNISVCLHERDFQVGLSILENIVSCMDRSRLIMLIISKRFLRSQWCQFEMHLAQHRLLETRREDLILILLEEIPRRLRPNTLHYLMLTKTYIVWPQNKTDQTLFWKRLKKSLITQKLKQESVSLA